MPRLRITTTGGTYDCGTERRELATIHILHDDSTLCGEQLDNVEHVFTYTRWKQGGPIVFNLYVEQVCLKCVENAYRMQVVETMKGTS